MFRKPGQVLNINVTNHVHWPNYYTVHQHDAFEIYYLVSGNIRYIINDKVYEVNDSDIVIVPPCVPHVTRPSTSERHKRILFFAKTEFIENFIAENPEMAEFFSRERVLKPDESDAKYFRSLTDIFLDEYLSDRTYSVAAQKGIFSALIVHLKRIYDKDSLPDSKKSEVNSPLLDAPTEIKILHTFINDNFCEKIDLKELSEQVYLSPVYISSIFTKYFGMSFKKYLLTLRINKSKELLKTTNKSIETIFVKHSKLPWVCRRKCTEKPAEAVKNNIFIA